MGFQLTVSDYQDYLALAADKIRENQDYVTELDSATGDGDHWSNINMGFEKLTASRAEIEALSLPASFKKIGMIMMSVIGGSSGVLYGSAYIGAAKALKDKETIGNQELYVILDAMLSAIMERGNAKPGFKTMIDTLHPAVVCYRDCLEQGLTEQETIERVRQAALDGAARTAEMEAVRGRACYQANKGIGHLDPGAVTMAYQIDTLMTFVAAKLVS